MSPYYNTHQDKKTLEYNLALRAENIFFELKSVQIHLHFQVIYFHSSHYPICARSRGENMYRRILVFPPTPFLLCYNRTTNTFTMPILSQEEINVNTIEKEESLLSWQEQKLIGYGARSSNYQTFMSPRCDQLLTRR